ncbi:MAG: phage portal protein [Sphingomonadales bacterium]|jgi:HK97 family phage portal protein|nr:phage portal protein [Sphingomonadales bacterium]MBK9432572.1 phage portal protein [Sphingomonadales bacterium]MBL0021901.1 phage portal protein [Sphingomonadales bacterium]
MKIFGWKSAGRALARPAKTHVPLARRFGSWSLGEWPMAYEAQMRDGYLNNAIAQRAVRLVAEGVASAPLAASDDSAAALVAATSGGQSLLETLAAQLLLHGNGYVQLLTAPDGSLCELYALRPERVSVEADARGWPVAFRYKAGEAVTRLGSNELIHIRSHHPLDDQYGLGCLGAASGAIAIHNASAKWNKALLDNAARPSGALVHEGAETLSGEQFDRLKEELAAQFSGSNNAGRPLLLEGGLKWQALSLSPADMDFAGLKAAAAREIALAFGVPPVLLGLPGDATYANYREANKALWHQTILPLTSKILRALSQGMQLWFAGLSLRVDTDQVGAISEDRERLWAQVSAADFLTPDEKRVAIGLEPLTADKLSNHDEKNKTGILELKYNPWHDPGDGKFTEEGQGRNYGGGGASGSWDGPAAKNGRAAGSVGRGGSGSTKKPKIQAGGGNFGGGGASGSWDKPKPVKPVPKVQRPKRETVKPPSAKPLGPILTTASKPKTRKVEANGYHFELDEQNRTVRARGELRLDNSQTRKPTAQTEEGKPDRLESDHGGHFIGRQFGGPKEAINLFAQDANFNRSGYATLEHEWRRSLKAEKKVYVDIQAYYNGSSKRPDKIDVSYYIDGKLTQVPFPNRAKGN